MSQKELCGAMHAIMSRGVLLRLSSKLDGSPYFT